MAGSAERRLARTQPAVPPPTMMKSKALFEGGEKGWRGVPAVSATLEAARGRVVVDEGAAATPAAARGERRESFFFPFGSASS